MVVTTQYKRWNHKALELCGALGKVSSILANVMDDVPQGEMLDAMADLQYHVVRVHQQMFELTELEPYKAAPRD